MHFVSKGNVKLNLFADTDKAVQAGSQYRPTKQELSNRQYSTTGI